MISDLAREWIDTPFRHQGRRPEGINLEDEPHPPDPEGIDCAGLIVRIAERIGAIGDYIDLTDYARQPDGSMRRLLDENLDRVRALDRRDGDVMFFAFCRIPQHLAIYTESNTIIHAYEPSGKVIEHQLDRVWLRMLRGVYRYRT